MRNALRPLLDNLGSVILALLLAFIIWITATLQVDPFVNDVVANVPVTLVHQPKDTMLFSPVSEQADVEVRAPESMVRNLAVSDFRVTMDLSGVRPGEPLPVPMQVTCTNEAVRIQGIQPTEQTVHLEMLGTVTLPVALNLEGTAATGYQASSPRITPDRVALRGPVPYLSQVLSVTGSVNIEGAKENITVQAPVTPRGAGGKLVSGLQWTPDQVQVQVRISKRVGYKPDVEVVPDLRVIPAQGYRLGSVSVNPSVVTLKGPPSVLDSLPGFVKTLPISVSNATQNLSQRTALTVPTSIAVIDVNYVTVSVEVLPIQGSRTMTAVVEIQGIPLDWKATASPSMVGVILEGPDAVLSNLLPGDVQILLNLYDYALGVYRIQPIVLAPEEATVVSVIPETIEVAIERLPAPSVVTPTLPITPTRP